MKIAYNHLIKHMVDKPSIDEISNNLFQLGHEHEINNKVFDIEFTPNRGDCLSVMGLLRDLSVFHDIKYSFKKYEGEFSPFKLNFFNKAPDACPEITFLKIEISDNIKPYEGCLASYFNDLDLSKNNFFTDISNYLSYETGQPTHCYDSEEIKDELILSFISENKDFMTLLDQNINLTGNNLVFLNNNQIINLAGVIGGKGSACSNNTTSVIVECACFDPEAIIGKSIKYDIFSDAAHKFERGVDQCSHEHVLRRFVEIVESHTDIKSLEFFANIEKKYKFRELPIDTDLINKILGTNISKSEYTNYLNKLGFVTSNESITVPSYRNDIYSQNDLAEEIARSIGYNNIAALDMKIKSSRKIEHCDSSEIELKNMLHKHGFYEVINNPFVSKTSKNAIKIDNPLDSNREYLRTGLKENLLNNLFYNENRQKDSIKLYEISDIHNQLNPTEMNRYIGFIASGRIGRNYEDFSKKINYKYIKSILQDFVPDNKLLIEELSRDNLNTKIKNPIIYAEILLSDISIKNSIKTKNNCSFENFPTYKPISEYPSSSRDLSFSINDYSQLKKLEKYLLGYDHELLKEVFVFDFYRNEQINEIKIGFRFIFQSHHKTITELEVSTVMKNIIENSLQIDSVSIPGL